MQEEQSQAQVAAIGASEATPDTAAPITRAERIESIDVLRGLAVLGILTMNIPWFAFTSMAFFHPPVAGGFEGVNHLTWLLNHLFFDQKMMSIFSMLFGAGVFIFADRAMQKRGKAMGLFYRRLFWLLLIGLIHAYIFWEGDILVAYALCGALVYPLRRLRPVWLIIIATIVLMVGPILSSGQGWFFGFARDMHEEQIRLLERGEEVPAGVAGIAEAWGGVVDPETGEVVQEGIRTFADPTPEELAQVMDEERDAVRGSFTDRIRHRAPDVLKFQTFYMLVWGVWRVTGMMLLGMALYKLGFFSAMRSTRFYGVLTAMGFGLGLPIVGAGAYFMERADHDLVAWFLYTGHFNYFGSILVALGWVGLMMLLCRSGAARLIPRVLAPVGRMAFTNYLMQTLICSIIFFGWGFGLFSSLERASLVPIVVAIWIFQMFFSAWWLSRFRFGPMEWLWRSLTYWRIQPFRRTESPNPLGSSTDG